MSTQRDLISKIIRTRDLAPIVDSGITPQFFSNSTHRQAFEAILEHQTQYGVVPTEDTFRKDYPTYRISEADDALQYYVDQVLEEYRLSLLEDGLVAATDLYDVGDGEGSEKELGRLISQLNQEITGSRTVDLTETTNQRLERYKTYSRNSGSLKGISTGIDSLDWVTGGWQPQQFVTMAGPPKAGKSTLMLLSAIAASAAYYRVLFIGFEMSNEEQEERHDAIRAAISHKKLREGRLSSEEFRKMERMMRRLESMPPIIFCEDTSSALTLSGISTHLDRHKPHIVFVDGMYMMDDENGEPKGSPRALTNITRGFKQMMRRRRMPGVGSTQVLLHKMDRKKGVTANSIGYTSSFIQDSDQVIAVEGTDKEDVNKVSVIMGRNNGTLETYMQWDWETGNFTELEDYDETEEDPANPRF